MKYIFITTIAMVMASCGMTTEKTNETTIIIQDSTETISEPVTDTTNTVELLLDSLENISIQ